MDHINGFKAAVAAVLGCLTALWGWFGWLVVAWVACMLLDYATGTAAASCAIGHITLRPSKEVQSPGLNVTILNAQHIELQHAFRHNI